MKIDVNALLQLGVLSFTILGGWIAYLKLGKSEKSSKDESEELTERVEKLENWKKMAEEQLQNEHNQNVKLESKVKVLRDRQTKIITRIKEKNSFN